MCDYSRIAHGAAVHAAVVRCRPSRLSALLDAGPQIPLEPALHLAVVHGKLDHLHILARYGADLDSLSRGEPAIFRADSPTRACLLDAGANINAVGADGSTLFDVVGYKPRPPSVVLLLWSMNIRSRGRKLVSQGCDPSVLVGSRLSRRFCRSVNRAAQVAWMLRLPTLLPGPMSWVLGDLGLPAAVVLEITKWLSPCRI